MRLPFGFHEFDMLPYHPEKSELMFRVGNRKFVTQQVRNFETFSISKNCWKRLARKLSKKTEDEELEFFVDKEKCDFDYVVYNYYIEIYPKPVVKKNRS
jgi:hypothetical protein